VRRTSDASPGLGPRSGLQARAVASGVVVTFLLSLVLSGVVALVVYFASVSEASASGLLFYAGLFSLAAGAGLGARRAAALGWLHGAAVGLVYVLLSALVSLVIFPGGYTPHDVLRRLAMGCAVGLLGGIVGVNV
jgi:putative membrane protein (TIGR04086 family)